MINIDTALQYLNIDASNTADVSLVEQFINDSTAIIEYECRTKLLTASVTIQFKGDNYKFYNLNCYKVNSITTIKYRATAFDNWTTLANTEYILTTNNNMYLIVFKDVLKKDYEYEIVTSQGVALADVPADLQKVAKEMVYISYRNQSKDILGKSNISEANLGTSIGTSFIDMRPVWRSILKKYTYKSII
jgi:hypothetical protein